MSRWVRSFAHKLLSVFICLCFLFGFCVPTIQSLTLSKKQSPVKPHRHEQHIPSLRATLNQLFLDIDQTFPEHSHSPCLIPGRFLWGPAAWPLITHSALKRQTRHPDRFGYVARPNQLWINLACLAYCSGKQITKRNMCECVCLSYAACFWMSSMTPGELYEVVAVRRPPFSDQAQHFSSSSVSSWSRSKLWHCSNKKHRWHLLQQGHGSITQILCVRVQGLKTVANIPPQRSEYYISTWSL